MPNEDSILNHPDFDALAEREKLEARRAVDDPQTRQQLVLRTVLVIRSEAKAARKHCREVCAPKTERRLRSLERLRNWAAGIAAGVTGLGTLAGIIYDRSDSYDTAFAYVVVLTLLAALLATALVPPKKAEPG